VRGTLPASPEIWILQYLFWFFNYKFCCACTKQRRKQKAFDLIQCQCNLIRVTVCLIFCGASVTRHKTTCKVSPHEVFCYSGVHMSCLYLLICYFQKYQWSQPIYIFLIHQPCFYCGIWELLRVVKITSVWVRLHNSFSI